MKNEYGKMFQKSSMGEMFYMANNEGEEKNKVHKTLRREGKMKQKMKKRWSDHIVCIGVHIADYFIRFKCGVCQR